VRPAIDANLIIPDANAVDEHGEPIEAGEFATFNQTSEFLLGEQDLGSFEIGGGTKNLVWHHPRYAAVEFCATQELEPNADGTLPPAECDPLVEHQWMVLERDLGSIRQPPVFYFIAFLVLFGLSLLGLHWYELDQREKRAKGLAPVKA
jgi:hypothetical protein